MTSTTKKSDNIARPKKIMELDIETVPFEETIPEKPAKTVEKPEEKPAKPEIPDFIPEKQEEKRDKSECVRGVFEGHRPNRDFPTIIRYKPSTETLPVYVYIEADPSKVAKALDAYNFATDGKGSNEEFVNLLLTYARSEGSDFFRSIGYMDLV